MEFRVLKDVEGIPTPPSRLSRARAEISWEQIVALRGESRITTSLQHILRD